MEKEMIEGLLKAISKIRTGLQDIEAILTSIDEAAEAEVAEAAVAEAAVETVEAVAAEENAAAVEAVAAVAAVAAAETVVETVAEEVETEDIATEVPDDGEDELVIEPAFELESEQEELEPAAEPEPEELFPEARNNYDPSRPWMEGLCGPAISNVFSAFSLNDRILYTKELFGGDSEEFRACIGKLNEVPSMAEAESYVFDKYNWDRKNPIVYRLMMAVRRRFNK